MDKVSVMCRKKLFSPNFKASLFSPNRLLAPPARMAQVTDCFCHIDLTGDIYCLQNFNHWKPDYNKKHFGGQPQFYSNSFWNKRFAATLASEAILRYYYI
ncbi:MAG: hypothetical protein RB296_02505 [Acidobacteriota bacterium]|nr:hypothetical protein [Acidobacteriota bacterium]